MPKVNYQLIDKSSAIDIASQTIITKRLENNLIIEGFYDNEITSKLIGKSKNGKIYAYMHESGQSKDAIIILLVKEMKKTNSIAFCNLIHGGS